MLWAQVRGAAKGHTSQGLASMVRKKPGFYAQWFEKSPLECKGLTCLIYAFILQLVPGGHPSSFCSSWATRVRARQEPKGVSKGECLNNPLPCLILWLIQKGGNRGQGAPTWVCSSSFLAFSVKPALPRHCQAHPKDTTEKRTSIWYLSSLFFTYPILNHSLVILDIFDPPPGPASYKVTQCYLIKANFCFLLEGSTDNLKE